MRKFICLFLAILFMFTSLPISASENSEEMTTPSSYSDDFNKKISLYINNIPVFFCAQAMYIGDVIYLPSTTVSDLLKIDYEVIDFDGSEATKFTADGNEGYFFANNYYAILNGTAVDLDTPSYKIDGELYIPCKTFISLFNIDYKEVASENVIRLYLDRSIKAQPSTTAQTGGGVSNTYENIVNSRGLKSDTNYLIWVSKANYSVRLFKKVGGSWQFQQEYPCAIGKPSSPTCEGVFKYYEKIKAWKYANYYVGPVMRFNRGYALHSTLMRYNGVPYDDRVGVKISAGCVRMHQADIQYLWDTVPLQSTVYVTAE